MNEMEKKNQTRNTILQKGTEKQIPKEIITKNPRKDRKETK